MRRTAQQRLDAIPDALRRGDEFRARVTAAAGDVVTLADMMAEAIAMERESRPLETVDGHHRVYFAFEHLQAEYCLDAARAAYVTARDAVAP